MPSFPSFTIAMLFAATLAAHSSALAASRDRMAEDFIADELPPNVRVVATELEGPVFADASGRTLYKWPKASLRNGNAGEVELKPTCDDRVYRENSGLMSPYPPGLELPEVEARLSCAQVFPPFLAPQDAKAIGKWTVVDRPDGRRQWAYDGWALYTSYLDQRPGDVLGGSNLGVTSETGATRVPVGPNPNVPAQFSVVTTMLGRLVVLREGESVYSYDRDQKQKSNCSEQCLDGWAPVVAAAYARPIGDWTIFERAPGVKQWAFRGKPLYRHLNDRKSHSLDGSDIPGWQNVFTQKSPEPPKGMQFKDTLIGVVLGDERGRTIYRYRCTDDAFDQQSCDHPDAPQAYRFAICGGGVVDRCLNKFPYVLAPRNAKTGSQVWSTMYIEPRTGKRATEKDPNALNVWAFRGRPVYTFAGDKQPTDVLAQAWGEFNSQRNGYAAMVYRDVFLRRDE